jgi:hypothetical protein
MSSFHCVVHLILRVLFKFQSLFLGECYLKFFRVYFCLLRNVLSLILNVLFVILVTYSVLKYLGGNVWIITADSIVELHRYSMEA